MSPPAGVGERRPYRRMTYGSMYRYYGAAVKSCGQLPRPVVYVNHTIISLGLLAENGGGMEGRIRLAVFDNCSVRRAALVQLLHHSGRYHVPFHRRAAPGSARDELLPEVDGALVAVGEHAPSEHELVEALRKQMAGRPILAYVLQAAAQDGFGQLAPCSVESPGVCSPHACAGVLADSDAFVRSVDQHLPLFRPDAPHALEAPAASLLELLSPRERVIFRMLGEGRTVKSTAEELCISVNTTHTHARRIRIKLRLPKSTNLVAFAIQTRLRTRSQRGQM